MTEWMPPPAEELDPAEEEIESGPAPDAEEDDLLLSDSDDEFQD